jgi:sterol desaturase/sphingolipid hydroxylase (fatty acid hydroxylase superfamily)
MSLIADGFGWSRFAFYGFAFLGIILARYFAIAGGLHLFFYSAGGDFLAQRTTRLSPPTAMSIHHDIQLSLCSAVIFALCAATIVTGYEVGVTRLYTDIHAYGLWYLGVSYVLLLLLQDTYFYFIHRLFHHPRWFRWFHQGHHLSHDPTPWTSFAFDPPEAVVQSLFLMAIVSILPLHLITVIALLITMTVWAVVNHLGLNLFSPTFPHHWLGKWFIGPAHHSIHHHRYRLHYGLYFTFWDKLLGTNDPSYDRNLVARLPKVGLRPTSKE